MEYSKQELIGSFNVIDNNQKIQTVVVCQDLMTHYSGDINHYKKLHLNSLDGVPVYKTKDPEIFKLADGSILRRKRQQNKK